MIPTTNQITKVVSKYILEPIDAITAACIAEELKLPVEAVHFQGLVLRIKIGDWVADVNVRGENISVSVRDKPKSTNSH